MAPVDIGADPEDDAEAERSLLARFLYCPPDRRLADGSSAGLTLLEVQKSLTAWLRMVTRLDFAVAASDPPTTDGHDLFLPPALPAPRETGDRSLYKVMGLVQLGLVGYGLLGSHAVLVDLYEDWVLRSCYHLLSARYVLDRQSRAFPGIAQDLLALSLVDKASRMRVNLTEVPREGMPAAFRPLYQGLVRLPDHGSAQTDPTPAREAVQAVAAIPREEAAIPVILGQARKLRLAFRRMHLGPPPIPVFAGILRPEWILADQARDRGAEDAWRLGPTPLRMLKATQARAGVTALLKQTIRRAIQGTPDENTGKTPAYGLLRDEVQARAGVGDSPRWRPDMDAEDLFRGAALSQPEAAGAFEYDEWDTHAGLWRLRMSRIVEQPAPMGPLAAWDTLFQANRRAIGEIQRSFAMLQLEERWLHGQLEGSDLDLDRLLRAVTDVAAGQDPDPRIHLRFQRQKEQVAIMTLVDLSGSTQGKVIHLEQEALVLLAGGLQILSFPHAFYGFHNHGPRNCLFECIKSFGDPWTDETRRRLANLQPGGATRLGAFLRHAGTLLERRPEPRRVLLVLSDGRPEDRGEYQGAYGIDDSALAVHDLLSKGIHVHCISLDPAEDAPRWLERVFGPSRFLILPRVEDLPRRLPELLRRLIR